MRYLRFAALVAVTGSVTPALAGQISNPASTSVTAAQITAAGGLLNTGAADNATIAGTKLSAAFNAVTLTANAALPTANLPISPFNGKIETATRSLSDRFSDVINVKGQGALGDGTTDDTAAFMRAIAIATGNVGSSSGLSAAQQTQLSAYNGVGPAGGKSCIDAPPGTYLISAPLVANLLTNNAFCMRGAGPGLTKLRFSATGDGLDINFAASTYGNDIAGSPSTNYPGQSVLIKGIGFQTAYNGLSNTGVALNIKGIPLVNSNVAPNQVIEDVTFTNADGWSGYQQAWGVGLRFTDPDMLYMKNVKAIDLRQAKTAGFQMVSDTPSGGTGHGQILCEDCESYGGSAFFDISGRGIQGVFLERPSWLDNVKTGVTWLAANGTSSGSLSIHAASGSALQANVHVSNIGTYFSSGSFYYSAAYTSGLNWYGEFLDAVDWVNVSGDIITAPPAGAQASGPATTTAGAYGIVINQGNMGTGVYDALPSLISNVSVAGSDIAFSAQGPNVLVQGGICGPNSSTNSSGVVTATKCFANTYTGTDVRFNPHFENMVSGDNLVYADAGQDTVIHGSPTQQFSAGLEIGMPGIAVPGAGSAAGTAGHLDWHSSNPSDWTSGTNGTLAHQVDYDCRELVTGGSSTVAGQGAMTFSCAGGVRSTANMYAINFIASGALQANTIGAVDPTIATYMTDPSGYLTVGPFADGSPTDPAITGTGFSFTGTGSGTTINCANTTDTYAAGTVKLPASPLNQQHYALRSTCTISALTMQANTGQTLLAYTLPTQLTSAFPMEVVYDAATKAWTQVSGTNTSGFATQTALASEAQTARTAEASKAPLASPAFTGNPTVPTPAASDKSVSAVNSSWVAAYVTANASGAITYGNTSGTAAQGNDSRIVGAAQKSANLSDMANLVSARVNLSAAASGSNADITALTGLTTALPITEGGTGAKTAAAGLLALGGAPLNSPAFTNTPTAPTASCTTNTTQLATTAFVLSCATGSASSGATSGAITATSISNSGTLTQTGDATLAGRLNMLAGNAILLKYNSGTVGNYISGNNGGGIEIDNDAGTGNGRGNLVVGTIYANSIAASSTIIPVQTITASYTAVSTDCGTNLDYTGTTGITVTIPTGLGTGCRITVSQDGTGSVSLTNGANEILAAYNLATSGPVTSTTAAGTITIPVLGQNASLVVLQKPTVATASNGL